MNIFDSSDVLSAHKEICCLSPTTCLVPTTIPLIESKVEVSNLSDAIQVPEAIAIDCEMVGGGYGGILDICVSVCLIDESENVLFHTYVKPILPVTNYRYDITGLTEEHLKDAMPLEEVEEKILKILRNGETISRLSLGGGKGRLLVGHSLKNDLECLRICYPDHMLRDTAMYHPLMKTNLASHSLKYLTKTYLGYEIQSGIHDPFENCVAAIRLYKRMRAQDHPMEKFTTPIVSHKSSRYSTMFHSMNSKEL
ncbi:Rna exonuclease [Thalictrum thalictroides]|uniref:RNA exonuclease 4 n=1 Tax=Thalictrum thalictroides TaxID=46969 RepID=A0A7J6X287_THATH|nr:Rna exonuclease [Thalictrum thalictroides]